MATENGKRLADFGQSEEGNPMGFVTGPGARAAGFDTPKKQAVAEDFAKGCPTGSRFVPNTPTDGGGKCIDIATGDVIKVIPPGR